jgi:tetratricopeptide (TPR) repeat protein
MAIVFYMKALEIAKQREDEPQETEACLGLGHAYRMNNKVEMAIEYFKKGLEIAKKREDKEHKALAYFGLGDGYGMINQFEIAIEYFLKALEIPVTCLDEEDETEIYLSLGYAHKLENQIKTAAEYYQGASEISKEHEKTQKVLQGSEMEETRESDVDDDLKQTPSAMKRSEEAVASLSTITGKLLIKTYLIQKLK